MFVPVKPTILHADLDAFYASVEQRDDPRLRGRPVIVGGGVVLAASYEAKACGVRTAMGGRQALALCPRAVVVAPRMAAYSEASRAVFRCSLKPRRSSRHCRSMRRSSMSAASSGSREARFRSRADCARMCGVRSVCRSPVGVARTKFLAKVASGVAKPDGLLLVPEEGELAFLHPLGVQALWGVGKVTCAKLRVRGIETVGQVAHLDEEVSDRAAGTRFGAPVARACPQPRPESCAAPATTAVDRCSACARLAAPDTH